MGDEKQLLFTLFRMQLFLPEQMPLLTDLRAPAEYLKSALMERPTVDHVRGAWHIGNVQDIPPTGLYFAIGKQLPREVGRLDDRGDFQNSAALVAPNTHVLLDLHYQILGIAKNSELAPASKTVARKLQTLLQATETIQASHGKVEISLIEDPTEFLQLLEKASAVTKFQVSYRLPNVWDAEADFQVPFQKTSRTLGAREGTATFKGEDLQRGGLVNLTRAAAAVGKRAKAWIRRKPRSKPVPVAQKQNPVTHATDSPEDVSHPTRWAGETLAAIRQLYEDIRSREE